MHVCLLLSQGDLETIQSHQYSNLSSSLTEILKALSSTQHVNKVSFAFVPEPSKPKPRFSIKLLTGSANLFSTLFSYISSSIDILDCFICRYDLSKRKLTQSNIQSLLNKSATVLELTQSRRSFYSYTRFVDPVKADHERFDLLLRGSGICVEQGEILYRHSAHGLLSLHHGNNILNRGGPVGFWEVFYKEESGITAQILTSELDGGHVIHRCRLKTLPNARANRANIYRNTSAVLQVALAILSSQPFKATSNKPNFYHDFEVFTRPLLRRPAWFIQLFVSLKVLLPLSYFSSVSAYLDLFYLSSQILMKSGEWQLLQTPIRGLAAGHRSIL